ncbi:MAG: glycosyltransferase family 39 protein, partial [Bryobacteraceae bacterium]|nr:glycosyltransferase family 39 protein [Bryobacteraceae bacterium]
MHPALNSGSNAGPNDRFTVIGAALCALLLIVLAIPVLERPGMQTDETLFAAGVYGPYSESNVITIAGHPVPLMVMTYVGTLKAWMYRPILAIFGTSPWAVRLPGVLLSALSVFVFSLLAVSVTKSRAALLAGLMLACDPIYVLYSRWDHGPVVTLHVLLVFALLFFVKFWQDQRLRWLALGSLCLGLGLWEKAVFMWLLVGLAVSLPIAFGPRTFIRSLRPRALFVASLFFVIGAAPLIVYNVKHSMVTFRSNTKLDTGAVAGKTELLKSTFNGDALFGSMMREPWDGPVKDPMGPLEVAIAKVSELGGERRKGLA